MKKLLSIGIGLIAVLFICCKSEDRFASSSTPSPNDILTDTYYVDSEEGDDKNSGTQADVAWKSLAQVNKQTFGPGAKILFKSDAEWHGEALHFKGSGAESKPVLVSSYGEGKKPAIHADGMEKAAIILFNQSFIEIDNLEVTNYKASEEGGLNLPEWESRNLTEFAEVDLPAQETKQNEFKFGIYVEGKDVGALSHIHLKNVLVHGVNGAIDQGDEKTKNNGGVAFVITGNQEKTWFEDILVEDCTIRDVDRTGLYTTSSWSDRSLLDDGDWTPSKKILIRKNTFQRTGANALIVRVSEDAVVEHNLFDYCAIKGSGNAAFCFNTDGTIFQYNEARFTKANEEDRDAGGLDSDYRTKNTVLQYNWLHDNEYGLLVTGGGNVFNDGTIIRYNIIERDGWKAHPDHGKFVFKISGTATNTSVYNNTVYLAADQSDLNVIRHASWSKSWPDNTVYTNNLFYNESADSKIELGNSTQNSFEKNMTVKNAVPIPNQVAPGNTEVVEVNNGPDGYQLIKGSAAIGGGVEIKENGGKDYFGNDIPASDPNIGACEGSGH